MSIASIDETLEQLIPKGESPLFDAAHYSLEGGKRLRPLLLLAVLETYDVPIEKGLYPAAALEMIHTYSLIHDDLPCMDDDAMRRGKPTLHKAYPESHAVLTGDFLLTYAFETLSRAPDLSAQTRLDLVRILSNRAGSFGMIGGQLLDIECSLNWEEMHRKKTGALISAALQCGGVIASGDLDLLKELGNHLGLVYQLVDDLIDGDGATLLLGKTKVEEMIERCDQKIGSLFETFPSKASRLTEITSQMIHRIV